SPIDQDLARLLRKSRKPVILVINKIDHPNHEDFATDFDSLGFKTSVSISAAHGRGTAELFEMIDEMLAQVPVASDGASTSSRCSLAGTPMPQTGAAASSDLPSTKPRPLQMTVVGRPNVGKSSIINAITRVERAIVSELPGTTRDSIDISYQRDGDEFVFIDTAGIRRRGKQSSSVEVFSVMRSEKSIRRADLCVLTIDITSGVTAQDKKIAGLIQEARKACVILVNKLDLVQKGRPLPRRINELADDARQRLFFLDYAPVLVTSAITGEHVDRLFRLVEKIKRAAQTHVGTGQLNRLLRAAFAANPPPMVSGRRLKLFYATHKKDPADARPLHAPEFVLFVNEPRLLGQTYRRYLEAQIRAKWPYPGLPILLSLRPRSAGM
ncbi:MAG TPA: ribosome biogenesis GTPase Der, partial [Chthoniobacterales bacterium]